MSWLVLVVLVLVSTKEVTYFVDLQPYANKFTHDKKDDNNLSELRHGEQVLKGLRFLIGERYIALRNNDPSDKPREVRGVKVGRKFATLHFLHATEFGGAASDNPAYIRDGTKIGEYRINFEDKTTEVIPIVYGVDVRDWWFDENSLTGKVKIVWEGRNPHSAIRLYVVSWKNPRPDKLVVSIDYRATSGTTAAPFCVAMTAADE